MASDKRTQIPVIPGIDHKFHYPGPNDPISPAVARRGIEDRIADLERDARFAARRALPEANQAIAQLQTRADTTDKAIAELAATVQAQRTANREWWKERIRKDDPSPIHIDTVNINLGDPDDDTPFGGPDDLETSVIDWKERAKTDPITLERIAIATGEDLDDLGERLGVLRRGSAPLDVRDLQTDEEYRPRVREAFERECALGPSGPETIAAKDRKELDEALSKVEQLTKTHEDWKVSLIGALGEPDCQRDMHAIIGRVSALRGSRQSYRHIMDTWERKMCAALGKEPGKQSMAWMIEQAGTAQAEIERLRGSNELIRRLHRERIGQCNTTQAALDKFQNACGDQAIQIMELRGQLKSKDDDHEAEVSSLRQSLWAAQNERDQATGALTQNTGPALDELRTKLADAQRSNEELRMELAKVNKVAEELTEERKIIDMAHERGVSRHQETHRKAGELAMRPTRAELVTWLLDRVAHLEQEREGQAEALARLRRVQPVLDLMPTWALHAYGKMPTTRPDGLLLSYEIPLYQAWKALEMAEAQTTTGIALDGSTD